MDSVDTSHNVTYAEICVSDEFQQSRVSIDMDKPHQDILKVCLESEVAKKRIGYAIL